ncbi:MAG: glycogen synthase [Euryarchaeota archaeon]|nr:glycogen synthase [Euryarchaeota archaeon]
MMKQNWIILAGEEAGPGSNKMGGIWNVIDAQATTLASLINSRTIKEINLPKILVVGPYYGHSDADWNKGLDRITDMGELKDRDIDDELSAVIDAVKMSGIEIKCGIRKIEDVEIVYLMFDTENFGNVTIEHNRTRMSLENKIKAEAYDLIGLDSMTYEKMGNGPEYTHYLNLSYAISEFIRTLINTNEDQIKQLDTQITELSMPVTPRMQVCLHCHEFGAFYTIARLKKLRVPVNTVATFHATIPGRSAGHRSIQKIRNNDSTFPDGVAANMTRLESLASYADVATAVGNSTGQEAKLFYGIDAILVRNGIIVEDNKNEQVNKERCRAKIQMFLSKNLQQFHGGKQVSPKRILPLFSISRIEIENKGYPDLLDALVLLDHMIKTKILEGRINEDVRVVCFVIAAQGPKTDVPEGFPVNLPEEVLVGEELRLQQMIVDRGLECSKLTDGGRCVSAVLYPQWVSDHDKGLNLTPNELMAGCIAGIFPSRYEPFLLTGLEAGSVGTPSIISKVCGCSDALKTIEHTIEGLGGVVVVDNIDLSYNESIIDYALALDHYVDAYLHDMTRYNQICEEAHLIAKEMNWESPTMQYYELLTGVKTV